MNSSENQFVTKEEFEQFKNQLAQISQKVEKSKGQLDRVSIVVFSGSLDELLAAFVMATGAAALGMETSLFFTFWGTSALKKENVGKLKKGFLERVFGRMLPRGSRKLPLSQMNMAGMGPKMIRYLMEQKNVSSLEELIDAAEEMEVKINVCEMSMGLMGIQSEEIRNYRHLGYCGVANFLEHASEGKITLFI